MSTIDDSSSGNKKLKKVSQTALCEGRSYAGFNFFDDDDQILFDVVSRGEFNISGLQNKTLPCHLPEKTSAQVSRPLKRLGQEEAVTLLLRHGAKGDVLVTPGGQTP